MSWLRNSPLRASFGRRKSSSPSPSKDVDISVCYESFRRHWQQAWEIIERTQPSHCHPSQDDVLGVVNLLDQMVNFLLMELRIPSDTINTNSCLYFLLSENVLDRLFEWSRHTREFINVLRLEQLKLYELLLSTSQRELLVHEPVLRPLLKLLEACSECSPVEVEKRLVILLNQLCVSLTQNKTLLDLFFNASEEFRPTQFVIFSLLVPFVHREGGIGQQARDALLLCMSLSRKDENVGAYIAEHSNFCPVLATGLSGLYSRLPRKLRIETEDWHCLTPEDVNNIPELTIFMNSLEFCNAVIQASHPLVQEQLLEYLYQGFLLPVLGPALHQETVGLSVESLDSPSESVNVEEIIAATAYFDLFLRSVSEPLLTSTILRFLLTERYEGHLIIDSLVQRIATNSRLCLVTLAIFETILDLNCEDVMLELVFKYLIPCTHIMVSQRCRVKDLDIYCNSSEKILSLVPSCCVPIESVPPSPVLLEAAWSSPRLWQKQRSPIMARHRTASASRMSPVESYSISGSSSLPISSVNGSLSSDYVSDSFVKYLQEARRRLHCCWEACKCWSYLYDGDSPSPEVAKGLLNSVYRTVNSRHDSLSVPGSFQGCNRMVTSVETQKHPARENNALSGQDTQSIAVTPFTGEQCQAHSRNGVMVIEKDSNKTPKDSVPENVSNRSSEETDISSANAQISKPVNIEKNNNTFLDDGSDVDTDCTNFVSVEESNRYESFGFKVSREASPEDPDVPIMTMKELEEDTEFWSILTSTHGDIIHWKKSQDDATSIASSLSDSHICNGDVDSAYQNGERVPGNEDNEVFVVSDLKSSACTSENTDSAVQVEREIKNSSSSVSSDSLTATPNIGPFLDLLLKKLEGMLSNGLYINLHLTGVLSRLAIYPQPLLRSFLLNHTFVFQPSIRSLIQIIGSLKYKIDSLTAELDNINHLVQQAHKFLISRLDQLSSVQMRPGEHLASRNRRGSSPEVHTKGEPKKRSMSLSATLSSVFKRSGHSPSTIKESALESMPDGVGYRYINRPCEGLREKAEDSVIQNSVLCAVLLDEWLKELAAITQEHCIFQEDFNFRL